MRITQKLDRDGFDDVFEGETVDEQNDALFGAIEKTESGVEEEAAK